LACFYLPFGLSFGSTLDAKQVHVFDKFFRRAAFGLLTSKAVRKTRVTPGDLHSSLFSTNKESAS
jgi:hypothetical protein